MLEFLIGVGVFILACKLFPRTTATLTAFAIVGIVGLFGWKTYTDKQRAKEVQALSDGVEIVLIMDREKCRDPKYPMFVRIINRTSRPVTNVVWHLAVYTPGHTTNLMDDYKYDYGRYEIDRSIPPGKSYVNCWWLPTEFWKKDWKVERKQITADKLVEG